MSTIQIDPIELNSVNSAVRPKPARIVWLVAFLTGLAFAWPLICAALIYGQSIIIRSIGGDTYHYLAIARKAVLYHIYTYDGVHVTNGFHPLWEYTLRAVFTLLHLQTHEAQAITLMWMSLFASTVGIILASVAISRFTNSHFLALLVVPGLFFMAIGVHVGGNWIWSTLDGMESALSVLFGGIFFFVLSFYMGCAAGGKFDLRRACRALGLVLPFIIFSRLDDFFLIPAFFIAILLTDKSLREKISAGAWIAVPSAVCILFYLAYNKITVGAAMPLSGATKAGFVGFLNTYLTAAIHFPPIFDLKALIMKKAALPQMTLGNSFRQVEVFYPALIAFFAGLAVWRYKRHQPEFAVLFALCLFIPLKMAYNFLEVDFWAQEQWYYQLSILILSVLGALALRNGWSLLDKVPIAKYGITTVYILLMMLCGSQYYASIVYMPQDNVTIQFWNRKDQIRKELVAHGVTGIINFDDGITAFLLDFPNMHGFAYATDVEAQRASRNGSMLTLAYSRGINTIAGIGYHSADRAPESQADIRRCLPTTAIRADEDKFDFSLAYYDPALKMPFILFKPKSKEPYANPVQ